jgi:hypothetical protein
MFLSRAQLSSDAQSNSRRGHAHYQTIDVDRTRAANRPNNAEEPMNIRPIPDRSPRITANDESTHVGIHPSRLTHVNAHTYMSTQAHAYRSQDIEPLTVAPEPTASMSK